MKFTKRLLVASSGLLVVGLVAVLSAAGLLGQQSPAPAAATGGLPQPMNWTAAEDHRNMMDQLGIQALRPGPSGTLQVIGFQIGLPLASASLLIPQAIENTGGLSHDDAPPGLF